MKNLMRWPNIVNNSSSENPTLVTALISDICAKKCVLYYDDLYKEEEKNNSLEKNLDEKNNIVQICTNSKIFPQQQRE